MFHARLFEDMEANRRGLASSVGNPAQLFGVVIMDSSHLMFARKRAAVEGIDPGGRFREGP
jgi:hypothetical protein